MAHGTSNLARPSLDELVEAFELAFCPGHPPDIAAFLPEASHPEFRAVLLELVRVDLELRWPSPLRRTLTDYRELFPALAQEHDAWTCVAFEEYRARRLAGEEVAAAEYADRWGIRVDGWPLPAGQSANGCHLAQRANDEPRAEALALLGFELLGELGRGSLSRVYLARQDDLANRLVVLKIAADSFAEADKLAQLQHAHIVPIYSVHALGAWSVVCMPYFGQTTLADVVRMRRGAQSNLPAGGRALVQTIKRDADETLGAPRVFCEITPALPQVRISERADPDAAHASDELARLASLSYTDAVLTLVAQLASGLDHAHRRGIVHRDLKPANVLLADDGRPMLLDFNLSTDTKPRGHATQQTIGGTLPYMAPEQLRAFIESSPASDPRSDTYSLGVLLYELLTGELLFPQRNDFTEQGLRRALDERSAAPTLPAAFASGSPAVAAIVRRCLALAPAQRYASAAELQRDIERHLADLPLEFAPDPPSRERVGKWIRRHPRLTSGTTIALAAVLVIASLAGMLAWRNERLAVLESQEVYRRFEQDVQTAQLACIDAAARSGAAEEVREACQRGLARYDLQASQDLDRHEHFDRLDSEQRLHVRHDASDLLLLLASNATRGSAREELERGLAWNRQAERLLGAEQPPAALFMQRRQLLVRLGQSMHDGDRETTAPHAAVAGDQPRDACLLAMLYTAQRRYREALPLWQQATRADAKNLWAWYGLANCYERCGAAAQAISGYTACMALAPRATPWYFRRGVVYLDRGEYGLAASEFDLVLEREPQHREALVNRALARLGAGRNAEALTDLDAALAQGQDQVRLRLLRADVEMRCGDRAAAAHDREAALALPCTTADDWLARGVALCESEPSTALMAFERALQRDPESRPGLENAAYVLAEKLARPQEAIAMLDRAIEVYPEDAALHAARGVLVARAGRREEALDDAQRALQLDTRAPTRYQVAGIFALTGRIEPGDRARAMALLAAALEQGYGGALIDRDRDLDSLRDDSEFQRLVEAYRQLRGAAGATTSETTDQGRVAELWGLHL
ncbi:MAG: protein kinase [Pirellulales bacterium]|nr:protein kinase [Pirellulales bacterium]